MAHHPDNDGWFTPHAKTCQACAARERATQGTKNAPYVPEPGERIHVTYDRPASKPLPPMPPTT